MEIKKAPNEFDEHGNIADGTRTFTALTLSSNEYVGEIHDIPSLPGRAMQMGDPLTESDQYTFRSEVDGCGGGGA